MNKTQQWVFDVVSKMDDGEARMFALLVADDLHDKTIEDNQRQLGREFDRIQKSMNDDLSRYFLYELERGADPEQLVAEAAAVSIAKAEVKNDWYKFQARDKGGKFGRMTGSQYRAHKKALKAGQKVERVDLKEMRRGRLKGGKDDLTLGELEHGRRSALANDLDDYDKGAAGPVNNFADRWHQVNEHSNASTTMERIGATGKVVSEFGLATNKPAVATAGKLADMAGRYGPEAEKVVGPSMRKAAYRYRGTERRPDKLLNETMDTSAMRLLRAEGRTAAPGTRPVDNLTPEQKRFAAEGAAVNYMMGITSRSMENGKFNPGARKQNSRVPSATMADLHRQSGRVTPSEGILIDADGNVAAQAVGFAEDHYLPFNLKNLGALKGGSYVRTRESGGLTSEDIYTGLMSGARSMTVVSNSGIFTLHFDDDLRGGRRYNDKAKQMVGRYEQTLDAIQSNQVENPAKKMDSKTRAAIRVQVEDEIKEMGLTMTEKEVDAAVKERVTDYAKKPQLTPDQEEAIEGHAADILANEGEAAARKYRYQARDEALQDLAGQNYRLDGEGYQAALKAMKEQYPYYIDEVTSITATKNEGGQHAVLSDFFSNKPDMAYVKAKHLRPEKAQAGYFDEDITGKGKAPAHKTNYANWAVHGKNQQKAAVGPAGSTTGASPGSVVTDGEGSSKDRLTQAAREQQERKKGTALADEQRANIVRDVQNWSDVNANTVANNGQGNGAPLFQKGQHDTILAFNAITDADEKAAFLSQKSNVDALINETEKLHAQHAAGLAAKGGDMDKFISASIAGKREKATPWDAEKLKGTHVPKPMGLTSTELFHAQTDKGVQPHLTKDEPTLVKESADARKKRQEAADDGDSEKEAKWDRMVDRIEKARAVKFHQKNFAVKPATPQQGGGAGFSGPNPPPASGPGPIPTPPVTGPSPGPQTPTSRVSVGSNDWLAEMYSRPSAEKPKNYSGGSYGSTR